MNNQPFAFKDLLQAYYDCRRHKRWTINALKFEFNLEENLSQLYDDLLADNYCPGRSICFVVKEPKPREIWAADFRDRIVHHLIYNQIGYQFEKAFIYDSFSCLPKKGTIRAAYRAAHFAATVTDNWQQKAYYLKLDIANFFVSIDKQILTALVASRVKEVFWQKLITKIILLNPVDNCLIKSSAEELSLIPPRKSLFNADRNNGLPIGNLTSQFFSNVYLNELDRFIKYRLKVSYYVRYVDDLVLFDIDKNKLQLWRQQIASFLADRLKLKISLSKTFIRPLNSGLDFVGFFIMPGRIYLRKSIKARFMSKINSQEFTKKTLDKKLAILNSYSGLFGWTKSGRILEKIAQNHHFPGLCFDAKAKYWFLR